MLSLRARGGSTAAARTVQYRGVLVFDCTRQVYNLGNGGVPPILDFRGLSISHPQGHGELGPPQACRGEAGAGSDHDGTRNMSQGVNLLYLFRY